MNSTIVSNYERRLGILFVLFYSYLTSHPTNLDSHGQIIISLFCADYYLRLFLTMKIIAP